MTKIKIDIYFDGACKNVKNSKTEPFGVGVAVFIDNEYSSEFSKAIYESEGTSNIAEWYGCIEALKIAEELFLSLKSISEDENLIITIYSDSELITKQFNKEYQVRDDRLFSLFLDALRVAKRVGPEGYHKIVWIPREKNEVADELSKRGIKQNFSTELNIEDYAR